MHPLAQGWNQKHQFIKFLKRLNYEILRQADILESGGVIDQETRLYDETTGKTMYMRGKENAHDYRYHKDPDIPYIDIDDATIDIIRQQMPETPSDKKQRYLKQFSLSDYDADTISQDKSFAHIFDSVIALDRCSAKTLANWILGPIASIMNKTGQTIDSTKLSIDNVATLLAMIDDQKVSNNNAKLVFEKMWESGKDPQTITDEGLEEVSDTGAIEALIRTVLDENPTQLQQYQSGNHKLAGFFVGQVMKKVNPKVATNSYRKSLRILGEFKHINWLNYLIVTDSKKRRIICIDYLSVILDFSVNLFA